jgi:predicted hydrolase (HD superfamily)
VALTRDRAWAQLCGWTQGASLRTHARAVELVMRAAALRFGNGAADVERFGLAGLLHDADYESWPEEHPRRVVAWLEQQGESAIAYAVSAHYTGWGVPHRAALDRALLACDELTGFVGACALIRPAGLADLEVASVKKRLKDKTFAAKVDRAEIAAGAAALGLSVDELIEFVIGALRPHAAELGWSGRSVGG